MVPDPDSVVIEEKPMASPVTQYWLRCTWQITKGNCVTLYNDLQSSLLGVNTFPRDAEFLIFSFDMTVKRQGIRHTNYMTHTFLDAL